MSMRIQSAFKIDTPLKDAWNLLTDIERVAPCFPGAELGEALGDGMYRAIFKVRLGPVALSFAGKVGYAELHEDRALMVISASGSDTKGRGGAQGTARCELTGDARAAGTTHVAMESSVDLSGSIAQYGRGQGMIADLTQQLVDRFALNLKTLTPSPAAASAPSHAAALVSAEREARLGGLLAGALWRATRRFFARLFGRASQGRHP